MPTNRAVLSTLPRWVEPPVFEQGSIDPLGYLARREQIADALLPGVTVATLRARYLSFLCWAIKKTGNKPTEIDQWEIAISVGEYLRHSASQSECNYLGINLLKKRNLTFYDPTPKRLHIQTARMLYAGLLKSCEFVDSNDQLTKTGEKLADLFDKHMPRAFPSKVRGCRDLPCLSNISRKEQYLLKEALLEGSFESAQRRWKTFKEIGKRRMRQIKQNGVKPLLSEYLEKPIGSNGSVGALLQKAALLELRAVPLTHFFLKLYLTEGTFKGRIYKTNNLRAFEIREDESGLLKDVSAHLRKARKYKIDDIPLNFEKLKDYVLQLHRKAKADNPWVDAKWRILRRGLAPKTISIHSYRLPAFASLLSDIGMI